MVKRDLSPSDLRRRLSRLLPARIAITPNTDELDEGPVLTLSRNPRRDPAACVRGIREVTAVVVRRADPAEQGSVLTVAREVR